MPDRVLLLPAAMEYGLYRERYDTLVDDLEAQGVLVRLLPRVEQRSGLSGSIPTAAEAFDLVVHVGEIAGARLGTTKLLEILRRRLRDGADPRRGLRRAKLYSANGEQHEFALDQGDV